MTDIEFSMPKPSYTVDTLVYLKEKYPNYDLKLIVGEDNLSHFHKWKNHQVILDDFGLIVYPRPKAKPTDLVGHKNVEMVKAPLLDISATFIRNSLKEDKSIKYLVPQVVEEYLLSKKLIN